jgi:hypothetical protein
MGIEDNEMVEEFLNDEASEMIDHIEEDAKADLLLFYSYKTAQHMRIVLGVLAIWTVIGGTVLFAIILHLLLR